MPRIVELISDGYIKLDLFLREWLEIERWLLQIKFDK